MNGYYICTPNAFNYIVKFFIIGIMTSAYQPFPASYNVHTIWYVPNRYLTVVGYCNKTHICNSNSFVLEPHTHTHII